jgi:LDH2 family malate/lactate/ureidoglycolate dehydrogenase
MGATGVGAFFLAIDPKGIMNSDQLKHLIGEYIVDIKNIKRAAHVPQIYLPGEIENETEAKSAEEGIEIDTETVDMLNVLLSKLNCALKLA